MKDDTIYLPHMLECMYRIEAHIAVGRDTFLASTTLQDATLRNLQTMTEATHRLSDTVKATQSHIPGQQIAAFRNVLVHNYLGIDMEQVWAIIERDIPPLKQAVLDMLVDER